MRNYSNVQKAIRNNYLDARKNQTLDLLNVFIKNI